MRMDNNFKFHISSLGSHTLSLKKGPEVVRENVGIF